MQQALGWPLGVEAAGRDDQLGGIGTVVIKLVVAVMQTALEKPLHDSAFRIDLFCALKRIIGFP